MADRLRAAAGISRRQALTAGAGVLASSRWANVLRSNTLSSGKCVFVYDDSHGEDYTKTFPVHTNKKAPGCIAIVPSYLGKSDRLTVDQVKTMAAAGWEVMSHTMRHQPLNWVPIKRDVARGQQSIPVSFSVHGRFPGAPAWLFDGTGTAFKETIQTRKIVDGTEYVVLETGADASLDADNAARLRFTTPYVDATLSQSRDYIENLGVPINTVVAPFQIYGEYAAGRVRQFYAACANGHDGSGINHQIDPLWLNRLQIGRVSYSTVRSRAREVAQRNSLFLLGSHSWETELTPERIADIIDIVREEGLEITTLNEVLAEAGVIAPPDGGTQSHRLVVKGSGPRVAYEFSVGGQITGESNTWESNDTVGASSAEGVVTTLDDVFTFTGDLQRFSVTDGDPDTITVTLDGTRMNVGPRSHRLVVKGSGPRVTYDVTVSGEIIGEAYTWESNDTVGTNTVQGEVTTLDDIFIFTGELQQFRVSGGDPDTITVTLDGTRIPPSYNRLVVRGSGPKVTFDFSVTGQITGQSNTWERNDTVGTSSAQGVVTTLEDVFTFTGDLQQFRVTGGDPNTITVTLNGTRQSVT